MLVNEAHGGSHFLTEILQISCGSWGRVRDRNSKTAKAAKVLASHHASIATYEHLSHSPHAMFCRSTLW